MYGTRYDRDNERGDTSVYRSSGSGYGAPSGSGVSGSYRSGSYRSGTYGGAESWSTERTAVVDVVPPAAAGPGDWAGARALGGSGDYGDGRGSSGGRRSRRRAARIAVDDRRPPGLLGPLGARKQMPLWQELPLLLIVAFCLAVLIRTFLVQAFFIPSGSMENTLLVGDRVLVNKMVYEYRDPKRGEIVVFSGTDSWEPEVEEPELGLTARFGRTVGDLIGVSRPGDKDFIKRVIALPGDTVSCCDDEGRVLVNGEPLDEPYVLENSPLNVPPNPDNCRSRRFAEVTVPSGEMFVMGDHRLVSQDARCQGTVPIDNIIGQAFGIVWPSDSWKMLPLPNTFDNVPAPAVAAPTAAGTEAGEPAEAVRTPSGGTVALVLPLLLVLPFPARTRRPSAGDRRRLAE